MEKEHSRRFSAVKFDLEIPEHEVFWDLFKTWWLVARGAYPSRLMVTNHGFCGFVNDEPVFICFLYMIVGSKSAMQGYQVCHPRSSSQDRGMAIDGVTTEMEKFLKLMGYKVLVAYPGNRAILKRLKHAGFVQNDREVVQVIKEF